MGGKLQVVVGGQFGSEGKGAIAGYLASLEPALAAIRVAGSNAGHTVWGGDREWKLRHVPVAAVTNPNADLFLAAGSEIEIPVLFNEICDLDEAGYGVSERLWVDPQASVVGAGAKELEESLISDIGSTGKGVGATRSARIMRQAALFGASAQRMHFDMTMHVDVEAGTWLTRGGTVQIEGTQGYGLGLHAGFYPYCTSSDCRAIDFMAMAGVSPWADVDDLEVWVVFRTLPIRVAGNSGPLLGETSWAELGLGEERTTVTNRVRRVGCWDSELARAALEANGGAGRVHVALTMADHLVPEAHGRVDHGALFETGLIGHIERFEADLDCPIELVGTGPTTVIDRRL